MTEADQNQPATMMQFMVMEALLKAILSPGYLGNREDRARQMRPVDFFPPLQAKTARRYDSKLVM